MDADFTGSDGDRDTSKGAGFVILDQVGSEEDDENKNHPSGAEENEGAIGHPNEGDRRSEGRGSFKKCEPLENNESRLGPLYDSESDKTKDEADSCPFSNCPHLEELSRLKQENKQLLQQVHDLQNQCCVTTLQTSEVEIKFLSQSLEAKYKQEVETFLWKLLGKDPLSQNNVACEMKTDIEFYIDKKCSADGSLKNDLCRVPSYSTKFAGALSGDSKEDAEMLDSSKSIKSTCFNCLGEHMLQDCTKEKDRQRIAKNRQEFMLKRGSGPISQPRYHADNDLVFSSCKPGVLSKNLRHALGLHHKDLPFHIYKMRQLGYPPGWLKEAEISSSGLTLYDSEGKEVIGEVPEEGEVGKPTDVRVQYDPSRIVDYPGFNVYPERGVKDYYKKYGFPPMQEHQLKRHVVRCMKAPEAKPYKRKSSSDSSSTSKRQKVSHEVTDMEIEDQEALGNSKTAKARKDTDTFLSPLPCIRKETSPESPSPIKPLYPSSSDSECDTPGKGTTTNSTVHPPSPSLEELERARQGLIGQLTDVELPSPLRDGSLNLCSMSSSEASDNEQLSSTPLLKSFSASKSMHLGSPSIIHASKGQHLPGPEKFAIGISEHIPFENLPDSTGQFKKMNHVLKKIRAKVSNLR